MELLLSATVKFEDLRPCLDLIREHFPEIEPFLSNETTSVYFSKLTFADVIDGEIHWGKMLGQSFVKKFEGFFGFHGGFDEMISISHPFYNQIDFSDVESEEEYRFAINLLLSEGFRPG
jgi:hypothetical protein